MLADLDLLTKLKKQCKKDKYKTNPVCTVLNTLPDVPLSELPGILDDVLDDVLGRSLASSLSDGRPTQSSSTTTLFGGSA